VDTAGSSGRRPDTTLVGREPDLRMLRAFLDRAAVSGDALVLSGEAGVGKTALVEAAATYADEAGTRVLRAAGAQFEADVSFAGLHQLLYPLLDDLPLLSGVHSRALGIALGLDDGPAAAQLLVSNAVLALLEQTAERVPLLVLVDDLPWLDRASAVVFGFVARRVAGRRLGFLGAARTGEDHLFAHGGLTTHHLQPLDDAAAATLLSSRYPALAPRVRRRLQDDAQGNPLALLELPAALDFPRRDRTSPLPMVLPLSERLQSVFAARVRDLPGPTQDVLLLAALDGTGDLRVLQNALPTQPDLVGLGPAERAGLVHVDDHTGRLMFRHPLTRSAVFEQSTSGQRRRMHRALAGQLQQQPERRVWHLAEAATGPDEDVAALLQEVAHEHLRRGDAVGAIGELIRAAELSPASTDRSSRLAEAAYLGAIVTGDLLDAPKLLEDVRRIDPERNGSLAGAVATGYKLLHADGDADAAHRLLLRAIAGLDDPRDAHNKVLIEALYTLLMACVFGGRADLWTPLEAALERLTPQAPKLLTVLVATLGDPTHKAQAMLERLETEVARLSIETSPARVVRTAMAASYLDRLGPCREPLTRAVDHGRDGGAVTSQIEALFLLANDGYLSGNWDEAVRFCEEGLELCDTHSYRLLGGMGHYYLALIAAGRGDHDTVQDLADRMTAWAAPRRLASIHAYASHARALDAIGRGDFESAYQNAIQATPAGPLAPYSPHALWVVPDLIEAAVRTGRHTEAATHVAAMTDGDIEALSTRLALVTAGTAAATAPEGRGIGLFRAAVTTLDADQWPFDLARIQLAYGERLRRAKATAEARTELAAALDTFRRLHARPWVARASSELRAAGLPVGHPRSAEEKESLTPQQREIAMLAASGLTNKEIGNRLFLSHRTVGTHLYQVFPKLGITSRAGLRDALAALSEETPEAARGSYYLEPADDLGAGEYPFPSTPNV
jgi:DNA-binding CsgD family transcriptional regulator